MLLDIKDLTIGYDNKAVQTRLNLSTDTGELICLVGTNGTGKSTLLRTIAGLQPALSGAITLNHKQITEMSGYERATQLSLVLTDKISVENLSVYELVTMGRFPYTGWSGRLTSEDKQIIDKAIQDVNLKYKSLAMINHISDGEKQRAVIAKALAQSTPLVLLDEPTAHLDLPNRIEIMLLLRHLAKNTGKCFILSTHELDLAIQTADRIWLMTETGVETGIPEDMMLAGKFQTAFGSGRFTFDPIDGHCSINHGNDGDTVDLISDPDATAQKAWMQRALIRNGKCISETGKNRIICHKNGYSIDNDGNIYQTIEETLNNLDK